MSSKPLYLVLSSDLPTIDKSLFHSFFLALDCDTYHHLVRSGIDPSNIIEHSSFSYYSSYSEEITSIAKRLSDKFPFLSYSTLVPLLQPYYHHVYFLRDFLNLHHSIYLLGENGIFSLSDRQFSDLYYEHIMSNPTSLVYTPSPSFANLLSQFLDILSFLKVLLLSFFFWLNL